MNPYKAVAGLFFFILGLFTTITLIFAVFDPVAAKMADDANPFGNPHLPLSIHTSRMLFTVCCFALSYLIVRNSDSPKIRLR